MMTRVYETSVVKIDEKFLGTNYRRDPNTPGGWTHDRISLGWFILLKGSLEPIRVGTEAPEDLAVGDRIKVTMEKVK